MFLPFIFVFLSSAVAVLCVPVEHRYDLGPRLYGTGLTESRPNVMIGRPNGSYGRKDQYHGLTPSILNNNFYDKRIHEQLNWFLQYLCLSPGAESFNPGHYGPSSEWSEYCKQVAKPKERSYENYDCKNLDIWDCMFLALKEENERQAKNVPQVQQPAFLTTDIQAPKIEQKAPIYERLLAKDVHHPRRQAQRSGQIYY